MCPMDGDSWVIPGRPQRAQPAMAPLRGTPTGRLATAMRDVYYRYHAWRVVRRRGKQAQERSEDRRVLEQVIIPFVLSRFEPRTVLDIGREAYEAFYDGFFAGRELWTIDWNPEHVSFGSKNHIVDDVANLRNHFPDRYFDFILMNGVFGWGLNQESAVERAFRAIHAVLKPGGIFVLGWNDTPDLTPVPLDRVQALRSFSPHILEPLHGSSFTCSTYEHKFRFYTRLP